MNRLFRAAWLRATLGLWVVAVIPVGRYLARLQDRLCHIRSDSWHYRAVKKFHSYFGEEVETKYACLYWCVDLPISLISLALLSVIALALGGAWIWMLGDLSIWTYHHPFTFVLYAAGVIGGSMGLLALCVGIGLAGERLQKHCPSLVVVETEEK